MRRVDAFGGADELAASDGGGQVDPEMRQWSLGAVSRDTLAIQIAERLAQAIRNGDIPPGTRLVETDLAADMSTSRGPIREALRQLGETGLVQNLPRRGWFVTQPRDQDRTDLVVMRATLEGLAGRLVAIRREQEGLDLSSFHDTVDRMRTAGEADDLDQLRDLDWRFHELLCLSTRNAWLHRSWVLMRDGITLLMSGQRARYPDPVSVADSHAAMVDVIATRDPAYCDYYMRERLLRSGYRLMGLDLPHGMISDLDHHVP